MTGEQVRTLVQSYRMGWISLWELYVKLGFPIPLGGSYVRGSTVFDGEHVPPDHGLWCGGTVRRRGAKCRVGRHTVCRAVQT